MKHISYHEEEGFFRNDQVRDYDLPSIEKLDYTGLQPAYKTASFLLTSIVFLILGIALAVLTLTGVEFFVNYWFYLAGGIVLIWLLVLFLVHQGYKHKSYAVRERDLVYKSGWLWKTNTVVPYNRVQHCEVNEGPIDRMFGLAELKVFTAGGASSDLSIPGLVPETAERIKEYIVKKTAAEEEE